MSDHHYTDAPGFGGGQGREPKDTEDTGNALVGCLGWFALVFAAFVVWLIVESVREAPPRHPPFSELPADPAGRAK